MGFSGHWGGLSGFQTINERRDGKESWRERQRDGCRVFMCVFKLHGAVQSRLTSANGRLVCSEGQTDMNSMLINELLPCCQLNSLSPWCG